MTTIKDIAKAVGVSPATVSLALNNSSLVKMETKYMILKAAEELNYTPNHYARSLVTKENKVIGVAWMTNTEATNWFTFDDHCDTYLTEMISSLAKEIMKSNYSMLFEHYNTNSTSMLLPSIMESNRVDGMLIVGGIVSSEVLDRIHATKIPTVLIGSQHSELDYVDTDSEKGLYMAAEHLILNGHREIVFINSSKYSQASSRKLKGFTDAMNNYGIKIKENFVRHSEFSGKSAYEIMRSMWESGIHPTAIVTGHDSIAIGVMRFLKNIGLSCPEDISIIGFEDSILSEYCNPPLTTVRINKSKIGTEACKVLVNRISKPNAKRVRLIIEPELFIRSSTGKL